MQAPHPPGRALNLPRYRSSLSLYTHPPRALPLHPVFFDSMAATTFLCFNLQSTLPPSCAQISQPLSLSLDLTTKPLCTQGPPAPLPRIGQPFTRTSHENLQDALPPSVTSGPRSASLRLRHKQALSCTSSFRSSLLLKLGPLLLPLLLHWQLSRSTLHSSSRVPPRDSSKSRHRHRPQFPASIQQE